MSPPAPTPSPPVAEPLGLPAVAARDDGEERWLPLPGEVGTEIAALARAALGDMVPRPPEPDLDFNLLDDADLSPVPGPLSLAADDQGQRTEDKVPTTLGAEDEGQDSTAAEAAARMNLPKSGHLEVGCPSCSTTGLVPWDRLDGVLCCSGCWTWFQIGTDGRKTVVDPPAASQGALRLYSRNGPDRTVQLKPELLEEKRQAARQRRRGTLRLGPIFMAVVPVVFIAAFLYLGARWWSKPRVVKLPVELDRRAHLLVESWLQHDTKLMARLAHPNYRGTTRRWAFDHRPPLSPGQFDRRKAAIDVRIVHQDEKAADVEVHVALSSSPEPIVLRQRWQCLNGAWLFQPSNEPMPRPEKAALGPWAKN